jgi:hypothetical protein
MEVALQMNAADKRYCKTLFLPFPVAIIRFAACVPAIAVWVKLIHCPQLRRICVLPGITGRPVFI